MKSRSILAIAMFVLLCGALASGLAFPSLHGPPPIRVGVLHSFSGTMAISELPVAEAELLAIEEINAAGGLLGGRRVEAVRADGGSSGPVFADAARHLLEREKVCAVFGCWTSASRKTVAPIFEQRGGLLFYPVQYEGLEQSPNIIYLGAAPNQQIIPAVKWTFDNLGTRVYLVGSDYVFPHAANAVIKDQLKALGGQVVGEDYVALGGGGARLAEVVARIKAAAPDVILNTINGDTNVAFFRELRAAGIHPKDVPTVSFSIGETELPALDAATCAGDYAVWNYFQSQAGGNNRTFVRAFQQRYGRERVVSDPMEVAYCAVKLWAQAVEEAGTEETAAVQRTILGQSMAAPEGVILIDQETRHSWRSVRVGRIELDGQFSIVWDSRRPIRPQPFPLSRSRSEWEAFLLQLYTRWDRNWSAPGPATQGGMN
ncbi:urea ABC transporter substrate-binding protein [Verrucomicrobia bacterium LW23]|nr:urea ABC transporter substrate-binding protein [Verrucomicrobia bacterium LW23]